MHITIIIHIQGGHIARRIGGNGNGAAIRIGVVCCHFTQRRKPVNQTNDDGDNQQNPAMTIGTLRFLCGSTRRAGLSLGALFRRTTGTGQVVSRVDQGNMRKCLWEITNQSLLLRIILLREQTNIIA